MHRVSTDAPRSGARGARGKAQAQATSQVLAAMAATDVPAQTSKAPAKTSRSGTDTGHARTVLLQFNMMI